MRSNRGGRCLLFSGLAVLAVGAAAEVPAAPPGYFWQKCVRMRAQILSPEGWHFREDGEVGGASACFVSVENIAEEGEYTTGVSVNFVPRVEERTGIPVVEYAERFIELFASSNELLEEGGSEQHGLLLRNAEVLSRDEGKPRIRMRTIVIANPATGSLYIVIFETRVELWEAQWPIARPIVEQLGLETEM